jgi:YacP-like NYN domain-containing protein
VPYFLDANNLIGRARGSARPTEEDVQALIAEVASRLRRSRARAILFFDGPAGGRPGSLGSLSIRYPAGGGSADSQILAEVGRSRAPGEVVVVTADRELGRRSRDAGAKWIAPEEFWSRFGMRAAGGGSDEKEGEQRRIDVEDWMRYFGLDEPER